MICGTVTLQLINDIVNIVAVSKRLDHASIEQTLQTYTHLLKDTDKFLNETIENTQKEFRKIIKPHGNTAFLNAGTSLVVDIYNFLAIT